MVISKLTCIMCTSHLLCKPRGEKITVIRQSLLKLTRWSLGNDFASKTIFSDSKKLLIELKKKGGEEKSVNIENI